MEQHRSPRTASSASKPNCAAFTRKLVLPDGRIEIDNKNVLRSIRPIALNRKNALFAGHDAEAENGATICSLIETYKPNPFEPQAI